MDDLFQLLTILIEKKSCLTFILHAVSFPVYRFLDLILQGLGTDDQTLIRVIVSRCEVDMADIKERYKEKYNTTLAKALEVSFTHCEMTSLVQLVHLISRFIIM